MERSIAEATGPENAEFLDATRLATGLLGNSIASNLFMLGYAYQRGLVPLSSEAIERAIELNAVAVDFNRDAFRWGRRAALDPDLVERRATPPSTVPASQRLSETLDQLIERRIAFLTDYQDRAYAARYADRVRQVREVEAACLPGSTELTEAVARGLFKLMAYKDEYEVARLYTAERFPEARRRPVRRPLRTTFSPRPPNSRRSRPANRTFAQARESSDRGCCACLGCWRSCGRCAAPGSIFSPVARSARPNAG